MVTRGGSHSGVAKWDLRTQGGQVSRALITGLNADTASTSHQGGRHRYEPDSVQYNAASTALQSTIFNFFKQKSDTLGYLQVP